MTFEGPAVLDISQHFVERWNEIKKRKVFDTYIVIPWSHGVCSMYSIVTKSMYQPYLKFTIESTSTCRNIVWLALPHEPEYAPNEAAARKLIFSFIDKPYESNTTFLGHPHLDQWKAIGKQYKQCWHGISRQEEEDREEREERNRGFHHSRAKKTSRIQVIRSVSDWSHGVLTEHSIQDACKFCLAEGFLI